MAQKGKLSQMNMVYGLGAAIVILGALFKIQHWPYGSLILTIGMVVEAIVFTISAFERQQSDLDWSLVYPELAGGANFGKKQIKGEDPKDAEGLLSKKLDSLLKEAKIDGELMASLGTSIKNFEGAAKGISPTVDAMTAQKKYSEEMSLAAAQMESLNSLYRVQMESANRQATINEESVESATKLKEQMKSLASNLSSLNGVYGGMLSAMNKN
ncbi:gliding motility protein GldL [Subsaximicrobium wynnwilliamsii]|jgi:gliding motility-associated protein GldL|uniref:Gliding motility protein GldL n=1 Tax=Subsaximicrobium wynnwilliamsii TaxID=291179 RepID=A0A5C6ZKT8_9FLAO|nr:gliding motility protein GldL [Subsaximicrobium wynnwilliamsii]TXD84543.1 gliding motility protein GldL [Subsaximicrobium wynnwilliamsii]TXD90225.1 gliding motility protein GldL [Subsaximicrobium wynnwilliamsii]TXE04276.1 gliding motility protein GldL [Subsaximicrobium wynnwilliamsii]